MYKETNTFNDIMTRALARVSDEIDKREGSVVYDLISPLAVELTQAYIVIDDLIDLLFPDTSIGEYLDRLAEQVGIKRNAATAAIRKGLFYDEEQNNMDIDIGTKFSIDEITYTVIEKITTGEYKLQCDTAGKIGNNPIGILLPLEYNIKNLGIARISDILIPGEDEETDEELRARYFENMTEKPFAGNVADYKIKTKAIDGVGAVKVFPVFNGGGTVKLTILDSDYNKASSVLIDKVQQEICPGYSDKGIGLAPIGHIVTVDTVEEIQLSVNTEVTVESSTTKEAVKDAIIESIKNYLLELNKTWEDTNSLIIRKAQIENIILNTSGVIDVANTTINGRSSNIQLEENQIPVLNEVVIV